MRNPTRITKTVRLPNGTGWVGVSDPSAIKHRNPWAGLTPQEAYEKGKADERMARVLRELDRKTT